MTSINASMEPVAGAVADAPWRRPLPPGQFRIDWFPRFDTNVVSSCPFLVRWKAPGVVGNTLDPVPHVDPVT